MCIQIFFCGRWIFTGQSSSVFNSEFLEIRDSATGATRTVPNVNSATWSMDSKTIFFVTQVGNSLKSFDLNTGKVTELNFEPDQAKNPLSSSGLYIPLIQRAGKQWRVGEGSISRIRYLAMELSL